MTDISPPPVTVLWRLRGISERWQAAARAGSWRATIGLQLLGGLSVVLHSAIAWQRDSTLISIGLEISRLELRLAEAEISVSRAGDEESVKRATASLRAAKLSRSLARLRYAHTESCREADAENVRVILSKP